ncbi:uncharacterized protein LOC135201051 isoform X2 [Macrobrachium nipponense]|uniref:uncharacterized protein LOC135201051 isoform X2 n=1 Tax=Macrobrachium nipponense TaxID=159736 RepID=UPI0030C8A52E
MRSLDFWNCFLISSSLLSSVTPITIYPECQPKSKWTSEWLGSNASFIIWAGENCSTENKQTQNILIIYYTFKELAHSRNFNLITIYRSQAEIVELRDGVVTKEKVNFTEPIGYGWQEFAFSVRSEAEVWYNSNRLLTVKKKYGIHELTIDGSNVTVNCHKNEFQWTATSKEPALIPITFEEGKQTVGFYSNDEFEPVISLTNFRESVTLGWNGSSIVVKGRPLPETTEHRVSIFCHRTAYEISCTLEEDQSETRLKNFYPSSMPDTLYVLACGEGSIQVVLHQSPPPALQVTSASPSPTGLRQS